MYGIFVNSKKVNYALLIAAELKPYETRTRNVFKSIANGQEVAIVSTGKGKPKIVGYCRLLPGKFIAADDFEAIYRALALIPAGSEYDCKGAGKWVYPVPYAYMCEPFDLPENAVRHGRSYCEF